MCAIVDANVVSKVFGTKSSGAAKEFFLWIENKDNGHLVVGGKLLEELNKVSEFREWAKQAVNSGSIRIINKEKVDARENGLRKKPMYKSNDPHVIALAQVSGARLLYTNDERLQEDFNTKELIDKPRGKVYTTLHGREAFSRDHRRLLARKDLCQAKS